MPRSDDHEPLAARLHFVPRLMRRPQARIVDSMRGYFERARGWVILTTIGRTTGFPREVLLPCGRGDRVLLVISTYGWRSDWIRNVRDDPHVSVTWDGRNLPAHAEIVEELERKQQLVTELPFCPAAPFRWVHLIARPLLRIVLKRWVVSRPVVLVRCLSGTGRRTES